ncbi:MAG: metallophosphoesterase [Phycisphaerales bacterium]|nr:MAG: metallophosphoesterase [Phycisphaerales bacterium]
MPRATIRSLHQKTRYRRASIRSLLFTVGPNRLSGRRISRRHLSREVLVREVEVSSPLWPEAFDGLRIGHVSDFHLGELLPLERAVDIIRLLAEQKPDLVACTGDLVDLHHDQAAPLLEALAATGAPLGSFLVLGNHDELHCARTVSEMAADAGVILLRNEEVEIGRNGQRLVVAGIDWAWSSQACARHVNRTCRHVVHLLLSHNPKAFRRAALLGIPLTLAGHTHGGQVALPNRPNTNLSLTHRRSAGLFRRGHSRLYVTTGVGGWFPLRVNCPPEVVILRVRHLPRPAGGKKQTVPGVAGRDAG